MDHSVSILRKWSGHPLQFSWNFAQIVITPYDEHLQNLNEILQEMAWLWSFLVGVFSQGDANCSDLVMFKAVLLPNYINGQPQYFRDASNFTKYWKK